MKWKFWERKSKVRNYVGEKLVDSMIWNEYCLEGNSYIIGDEIKLCFEYYKWTLVDNVHEAFSNGTSFREEKEEELYEFFNNFQNHIISIKYHDHTMNKLCIVKLKSSFLEELFDIAIYDNEYRK